MIYSQNFEQNVDNKLVMSPVEFKRDFLFGVDLTTQDGLRSMTNETITQKLLSAQQYVEGLLDLKLNKQIIHESRDFIAEENLTHSFIRTSFFVNQAFELEGWCNNQISLRLPKEWLSTKVSSDGTFYKQIFLKLGNGNLESIPQNIQYYYPVGVYGYYGPYGFWNRAYNPQYWMVTYCTGFSVVPEDIKNFIGKQAAIQVLNIMGDIVLGAGIASKTIQMDGLREQLTTVQGNGNSVYTARINSYRKEMEIEQSILIGKYKSITMRSM